MIEDQNKTLSDHIATLKRRRAQILAIIVIIFGFGTIVALAWPPTYRSMATILIEEQQIPAELVQSTVTSYASQRIQTISQRVMTRNNLLGIMENYGLYLDIRDRETSEELLERMRDNIKLEMISAEVVDPRTGRPMPATIAFSLSFHGEYPDQVQKVANELTTLYLQENIKTRASKAQETLKFMSDEAKRLNEQITRLERELAEFKATHADSLPQLQPLLREQIERIERELTDTATLIRSLEDRRFYLQGQLGQMDPYGQDVNLSPSARLKAARIQYASALGKYSADHPDVIRLKREIESLERETGQATSRNALLEQRSELQTELASLQERYSAEHPDVIRLKREISALDGEIAATPSNSSSSERRMPDNPAFITLQAQLNATDNEIKSLVAKRADLERKRNEYEERLQSMPLVEAEYSTLIRDLENATAKYQEIKAKQMQAQVAQQLESESKGERFTLIDPPILPEEPIKPNRPAIIFLSFVLALGAGIGYALMADSMDSTIRGAKGVINTLHAAPLSIIPYLATEHEKASLRIKRRIIVASAFGIVLIGVLIMHFYFVPLDVLWFRLLRKATRMTGIDFQS